LAFNENNYYSSNSKGLLADWDFFWVKIASGQNGWRLAIARADGMKREEGEAPSHAGRGMEYRRFRLF
jgi:hypothetical protein